MRSLQPAQTVIPAKPKARAGIHRAARAEGWIPALRFAAAGMTIGA